MKNLETFAMFKLNEEMPFNKKYYNKKEYDWTKEEEKLLIKYGADEITNNTAVFRERLGDYIMKKHGSDRFGLKSTIDNYRDNDIESFKNAIWLLNLWIDNHNTGNRFVTRKEDDLYD